MGKYYVQTAIYNMTKLLVNVSGLQKTNFEHFNELKMKISNIIPRKLYICEVKKQGIAAI